MLGPFGAGNPQPTFASRQIKVVGRPAVDGRGRDLRFRVAQNGTVLSARLKNGAHRYEEMTQIKGPVVLTYVPRLAQWAEQGPVELDVADVRLEEQAAGDPPQARAIS